MKKRSARSENNIYILTKNQINLKKVMIRTRNFLHAILATVFSWEIQKEKTKLKICIPCFSYVKMKCFINFHLSP